MHPMIKQNPELKKLYELENYLTKQMLGKNRKEYRDLARLRGKVREKIRHTDEWGHIRNSPAYQRWLESKQNDKA